MKQVLLLSLLTIGFCAPSAEAQETPEITKQVLILRSTKSYQQASTTARQAAARLHAKLDLGGYRPNAQSGLTMSKAECEDNGFEYPAYVPRGREAENSRIISIEYSDGYAGFAKGYYLVVAAVGQPGSALVRQTSVAARQWYPDAYTKQTRIWVGCMH